MNCFRTYFRRCAFDVRCGSASENRGGVVGVEWASELGGVGDVLYLLLLMPKFWEIFNGK